MITTPKVQSEVVLLGAGFSHCVTQGAAPLLSGFFDQLALADFPNLWQFTDEMIGEVPTANVERVISLLDDLDDAPLNGLDGKITKWKSTGPVVRRELRDYCIQRLCCETWSAEHWGVRLLANADTDTTVITTNYDNLAESILSHKTGITHCCEQATCHHCRGNRLLLDECECTPEQAIAREKPNYRGTILKLHGSVAWKTCNNTNCFQQYCIIPDRRCRVYDGLPCVCCGGPPDPVLVLPTHRKRYNQFPQLDRLWKAAESILKDANRLIIFGASLSASDSFIRLLIREALLQDKLREVFIIDVKPTNVLEQLKEILPQSARIGTKLLPVPKDHSTPEWWKAN